MNQRLAVVGQPRQHSPCSRNKLGFQVFRGEIERLIDDEVAFVIT
ncbi:MAG TPA: hypothetical protein VFP68_06825 [Burkholderiaceae bacterium]|nr:hypothetical protein [Burkholderiaceae bacterium]